METNGKSFYNRQVAFLEAKDIPGLISTQYADDAELVSFDVQVKGRQALIKHFEGYLAHLGYIKLISTDKFTETPDSIFFEATVEVQGGIARVYDAFVLRNGQATHHFTGLLGFTPKA